MVIDSTRKIFEKCAGRAQNGGFVIPVHSLFNNVEQDCDNHPVSEGISSYTEFLSGHSEVRPMFLREGVNSFKRTFRCSGLMAVHPLSHLLNLQLLLTSPFVLETS